MEKRSSKESSQLYSMLRDHEVKPEFLDEDMIIIDNVRSMPTPEALRFDMNLIVVCRQGRLTATLNGSLIEAHTNQIVICPSESSLTNIMVSTDFDCIILCITSKMLKLFLQSHLNIWNQAVYVKKQLVYEMEEQDIDFLYKIGELLKGCIDNKEQYFQASYRTEIIKGFITSALLGLCNFLENRLQIEQKHPKQNISFFNRFLELLQQLVSKHRTVEYYASELCISSRYLTEICKKNSGKTANEWIREYTLAEITYYLLNTEMSIKEISNHLNFPNTSFFGKYVKEHLGCTPTEYRIQKEKG